MRRFVIVYSRKHHMVIVCVLFALTAKSTILMLYLLVILCYLRDLAWLEFILIHRLLGYEGVSAVL